jgi:DNA polymerase-3 subunit delta'
LLKIVEEPPPRSLFLLVAHKPGRVLPTIRSRCRKLSLKPLRAEDISEIILSLGPPWSDADDGERLAASSSAHGSVHEALRRLGVSRSQITAVVEDLLSGLPQLDWGKVHALADEVARPDGAEAFDAVLIAAFDWLDRQARLACFEGQGAPIGEIVACASAWEAVAGRARRMTSFNLDRRPVVWSLFAELAAASRTIVSWDQHHR